MTPSLGAARSSWSETSRTGTGSTACCDTSGCTKVEGWLLVNLELVRQGYASAVSFPPDIRLQGELRSAERVARDAGLGLWGPATPLP